MVYRHKNKVYCSDALSTAFKYPLVDGVILDGPDGRPVVETPLDGTQYDLATGQVSCELPTS